MYSYKTNIAPASLVIQHKNTPAVAKRGEKDPICLKSESSASGLQFIWRGKKKMKNLLSLKTFFFCQLCFLRTNPNSVKKNYVLTEEGFLILETSSYSNSLFVISQMPGL